MRILIHTFRDNEMSYHELLNLIIEKYQSGKNDMIRETGIDRSSFFKILSGKRLPTEAQFSSILHYIEASDADGIRFSEETGMSAPDALLAAFLAEKLDADSFRIFEEMHSFIAAVNGRDLTSASRSSPGSRAEGSVPAGETKPHRRTTSPAETPSHGSLPAENIRMVSAFISEELSAPDAALDIYLPFGLIEGFDLPGLIVRFTGKPPVLRQVIDLPDAPPPAEKVSAALRMLSHSMRFLNACPGHLTVYCGESPADPKNGVIFPYYVLGKGRLLLVSDHGSECVITSEPSLIEACHRQFAHITDTLKPLIQSADNYMRLAQDLLMLARAKPDRIIFSAEDIPCFFQIADDAVIRDCGLDDVTTDFGIRYTRFIQSLPHFYSMYSPYGYERFQKSRSFNNAGIKVNLNASDMRSLNTALAALKDKKMIQLPFQDCIIHDWNLMIWHPDLILLSPFSRTDTTFSITDRTMVEAFFMFYDTLRKCCTVLR